MTTHELAIKYTTECKLLNILPHQAILTQFNNSSPTMDLIIRGNDKINFHQRIQDTTLFPIVTALKPFAQQIIIIDLSYNQIQDDGANKLGDLIKDAISLKVLILKSNSIGPTGAKSLRKALKMVSTIEELDLSNNFIKTDGSMSLTKLLFTHTNLHKLDLGNNEIDHDGIIAITSVMNLTNNTLRELNLNSPLYNSIGQEMCIHLGKMLASNNSLKRLSLQKHKIRCDGLYIISEHLLDNNTLEVFDLSANEIGVEGCTAIGKYLTSGKCVLNTLYLSSNRTGDLGAKSLAFALESNKSLKVLTLNYNRINDLGLCLLAEGLDSNNSLLCLTLFGNNFAQKSMGMFAKLQGSRKNWSTDFQIYMVDSSFDMAKIDIQL